MYFGGLRFKKNKQRKSISKRGNKENQFKTLPSLHFESQVIEIYSWDKHILLSIETYVHVELKS